MFLASLVRGFWIELCFKYSAALHLSLAVFLLTFGVVETLKADEAASKQSEVERLVQELDSPQLARRNAAESSLLELGLDAIPFLTPKDASLSPEVRQRLERVRARIAKMTASKAAVKNTGDVRLGDAATFGAALEAISRDSGIEFGHRADEDASIEPYPGVLPFWHAVDYVLDQAKLDIDFYAGDDGVLTLRPRNQARPSRVDSAAYAGIYRLEPMIVSSRRVLTDASLSGMNIELEISWKPDSQPVGITLPLGQITARLDDGITIGAQEIQGTIDIAPSNDIAMTTIQLPLVLPAGRPSKIVSLSGQIKSMLPGETTEFEFPLKLGKQSKTVESVTVQLEEIRKNGPVHEIRLGVEYKSAGKAMESHRGWLLGNEVHVVMPDGSRQVHLGYELYRHNESGIGIGYLFDIGESVGESKLIYTTPTAVIENEIEFIIQDIPLP